MLRLLFLLPALTSAATLTISPPVIYDCTGFHGDAAIAWSGASGTVFVGVGPGHSPLTGPEPPQGHATATGWVTDGLQFFLINMAGEIEAVATARVKCGGEATQGSYFPLAIGNTWVYRVNSRAVTSAYVTHKVMGTRLLNGQVYFVIYSEGPTSVLEVLLLREDERGRILRWGGTAQSSGETVFLDPAQWPRRTFKNALGDFPDAIHQNGDVAFQYTDRVFLRGIGVAKETTTMISGSSGGFVSGLDLVEVRLANGLHLELPAASLTLSAEHRTLDVTGRNVTNCAIPCYFVACGIAGADPPGTYKPCTQARVKAQAAADFLTELELVNASSQVVYRAEPLSSAPGETVRYVQLPLYSAPNVPLPSGEYRLVGRMRSEGKEAAVSEMTLRIE